MNAQPMETAPHDRPILLRVWGVWTQGDYNGGGYVKWTDWRGYACEPDAWAELPKSVWL